MRLFAKTNVGGPAAVVCLDVQQSCHRAAFANAFCSKCALVAWLLNYATVTSYPHQVIPFILLTTGISDAVAASVWVRVGRKTRAASPGELRMVSFDLAAVVLRGYALVLWQSHAVLDIEAGGKLPGAEEYLATFLEGAWLAAAIACLVSFQAVTLIYEVVLLARIVLRVLVQ